MTCRSKVIQLLIYCTLSHPQTDSRMFLGEWGKNSSDMSFAVAKPLSAWLCQSQAQTRWQAAGAGSSFSQASLFPKSFNFMYKMTTLGSLFYYQVCVVKCKHSVLVSAVKDCRHNCETTTSRIVCCHVLMSSLSYYISFRELIWCFFFTLPHSLCCQFARGQCRVQIYHSCGEVIYIRADERDFPEWLWTFVKTLR